MRGGRRAGPRTRADRAGARGAEGRRRAGRRVCQAATGPREGKDCALQVPALGEVRERAAQDADGQDSALQTESMIVFTRVYSPQWTQRTRRKERSRTLDKSCAAAG